MLQIPASSANEPGRGDFLSWYLLNYAGRHTGIGRRVANPQQKGTCYILRSAYTPSYLLTPLLFISSKRMKSFWTIFSLFSSVGLQPAKPGSVLHP